MRETSIYGLQMTIEELQEKQEKMLQSKDYTGKDITDIDYLIDVCNELIAHKVALDAIKKDSEKISKTNSIKVAYRLGYHHCWLKYMDIYKLNNKIEQRLF